MHNELEFNDVNSFLIVPTHLAKIKQCDIQVENAKMSICKAQ